MVILKLMSLPGPLSPADYLGFIEIELHKTSDLGEIWVGDEEWEGPVRKHGGESCMIFSCKFKGPYL